MDKRIMFLLLRFQVRFYYCDENTEMMDFFETISEEINSGKIRERDQLQRRKLSLSSMLHLDHIPSDTEILNSGMVEREKSRLLRIKPTRTISGVAVVAAMTSPESCPHGQCLYCPGGVKNNSPQAYTGYEPSALRGRMNSYDPYQITFNRLKQLETIGHDTSKIDLIVMGGTFTARDPSYQRSFVKGCIDGMNGTVSESLEKSIEINETAHRRCVGITVETKPDWFLKKDIDLALSYGTTKVELGVQVINEKILRMNGRGHGIREIVESTKLSRDSGLKIVYHVMPGMYGSDREEDLRSFRKIVEDSDFKPDMLKIYPTLVVKGTALYNLWKIGKYRPPDTEEAAEIIKEFLKICPPWIRVQRMQRDIPVNFIEAGVKRSDIRNIIDLKLREENSETWEIRSREIGLSQRNGGVPELIRRDYDASGGREIFLSFEESHSIYGYLRLRIPSPDHHRPEMDGSSVVREIKVLGEVVPLGQHESSLWQHRGLGRALLQEAERITLDEYSLDRINVISGIGVREYFRRSGYSRLGPYMSKNLKP